MTTPQSLGSLSVELTADSRNLQKELGTAVKRMKATSDAMQAEARKASKNMSRELGRIGGVFGLGGLGRTAVGMAGQGFMRHVASPIAREAARGEQVDRFTQLLANARSEIARALSPAANAVAGAGARALDAAGFGSRDASPIGAIWEELDNPAAKHVNQFDGPFAANRFNAAGKLRSKGVHSGAVAERRLAFLTEGRQMLLGGSGGLRVGAPEEQLKQVAAMKPLGRSAEDAVAELNRVRPGNGVFKWHGRKEEVVAGFAAPPEPGKISLDPRPLAPLSRGRVGFDTPAVRERGGSVGIGVANDPQKAEIEKTNKILEEAVRILQRIDRDGGRLK